jgi:hypothetical protein
LIIDHKCCEKARPCSRCIRLGKQDTCVDVPERKRGRKSSKNEKQSKKKKKIEESPKTQNETVQQQGEQSNKSPSLSGLQRNEKGSGNERRNSIVLTSDWKIVLKPLFKLG